MENKHLLQIRSSFSSLITIIRKIREQKGREDESITKVNDLISYTGGVYIDLHFEKALTYQHLYMNTGKGEYLKKMHDSVMSAGYMIKKIDNNQWLSRYFRFLGRISDYSNQFPKSILYYKKAIKCVELDPDYRNDVPRDLELKGFLSYALIMSGSFARGQKIASDLIKVYQSSEVGLGLKRKDFDTWIIWFSGHVIRTVEAFIKRKVVFDVEIAKSWINIVDLEFSKKPKEYLYRKKELKDLLRSLN